MGGYLALAFAAAQFVAYFSYTNLGTFVAVKGADFLQSIGLTGLPLIVLFVLVSAFINLFMGSASAKWAIMAPIFRSYVNETWIYSRIYSISIQNWRLFNKHYNSTYDILCYDSCLHAKI